MLATTRERHRPGFSKETVGSQEILRGLKFAGSTVVDLAP